MWTFHSHQKTSFQCKWYEIFIWKYQHRWNSVLFERNKIIKYIYLFFFLHHHHHHIALVARISLTVSRHSSLSFIALGRSSGQHPVSSHSCWMYVRAGRPAFARPCVGIHKSTSLMSSSLLLQQCPACLVRLTWIVFVIGGRWPYSWCLVGCCCQDLLRIARSILVCVKSRAIPCPHQPQTRGDNTVSVLPLLALPSSFCQRNSWFISQSFDLHSPVGELRCLHQRAVWIRNPRKLLNSLPQSHVVAGYISRSLPYEQVWWVIYSPSPQQRNENISTIVLVSLKISR